VRAQRKYLVFSSVGRTSKHRAYWLKQRGLREFDLALVNYEPQRCDYRGDAEYYSERPDTKFRNLEYFLNAHPGIGERYRYVYVPDDDIEIDTVAINRLFRTAERWKLPLCQPAFTRSSATWWTCNKRIRFARWHETPLVEVSTPCFSAAALRRVRRDLGATVAYWGLDVGWTEMLGDGWPKVLDTVTCHHPYRPSPAIRQVVSRAEARTEGVRYIEKFGLATFPARRIGSIEFRWRPLNMSAPLAAWWIMAWRRGVQPRYARARRALLGA
jgi:hypothetical protein